MLTSKKKETAFDIQSGRKSIKMTKIIKVKLLSPDAQPPKKAYANDAGWDLFMPVDCEIPAGYTSLLGLGIAIEPPEGYYAEIVPRSSMAKKSLVIPNSVGIIDAGYRGEIMLTLENTGEWPVRISKGDRLVQLILRPLIDAEIIQAEELTDTERGCGGFGSTGK